MALDGNRLGTAIKDALVAAGVIQSQQEVHEWTITSAVAGVFTMTVADPGAQWSRDISYEAVTGESATDIRDGLKAAADADDLASVLFDWTTPAANKVAATVKNAGGTYSYSSTGSMSDAAGAPVTDASIEANAEATWQAIAGAIVGEIDVNAELNATTTATPGVID